MKTKRRTCQNFWRILSTLTPKYEKLRSLGSTGWVRELNTWYVHRCTTTLEWYTDTGPSPCLRISSFFSEVWIEIYRPLKENVFYLTLVHVPTQFGVVFVFLFTLDLSFHIAAANWSPAVIWRLDVALDRSCFTKCKKKKHMISCIFGLGNHFTRL